MVIAGIDEAGYGPILGPMTIGCAALEVDAAATGVDAPASDVDPDLPAILSRAITPKRDPTGRRICVNDSKKVYTPSAGLGELERSILVLGRLAGLPTDSLGQTLTGLLHADDVAGLKQLPWYRPMPGERFPIEVEPAALAITTNAIKLEFARVGCRVPWLAVRAIDEVRLNRLFHATHNKSSTSFTFVAMHIQHLVERFATRGLTIWCDRQGGREHYGSLLRQMYPDWPLTVVSESGTEARYAFDVRGQVVRLNFAEKAESQCMAVAIASMLAKYVRETLMMRFNAFWQSHDPTLKPTAGYWTDGQRFLVDVAETARRVGVDPQSLARTR